MSSATMKVHILRPESVTPIERYLQARRSQPDSLAAQLDFAAVLLYREREFETMFASVLREGRAPGADEQPFAPYGLSSEAAGALETFAAGAAWAQAGQAPLPRDLFGLKGEAVDGLCAVLGASASHSFGWLVLARLLSDLSRFAESVDAARRVSAKAHVLPALALIRESALLGTLEPVQLADGHQVAIDAGTDALSTIEGRRAGWEGRALEHGHELVRRHATATRARVEGDAFTRFWTTESSFCESERDAALAGFDLARVPAGLRELAPIARRFGVGDDVCRALFVRKASRAERRDAAAQVQAHADQIQKWLDTLGNGPYENEAACYFWLLEAAEEMR